MPEQTCSLQVNLFDGTRQPLVSGIQPLITIRDANQKQVFRDFTKSASCLFNELPYNNIGDNFTVVAWANAHQQAGFTPILSSPSLPGHVDLMLLKNEADLNFSQARWDRLDKSAPAAKALLSAGVTAEAAPQRYTDLLEHSPAVLACFFNLTTSMAQIHLPVGTPMDYIKELIWDDTMAQDRFFAWADPAMVEQVRRAAQQGTFAPEVGSAVFHSGATCSFKQVLFGEANVQLTFHEEDKKEISGVTCIKVEPDIDYYKDLSAHALLEVMHNKLSGSLTDPQQVYVLRWVAGRQSGLPAFDPPYTIA